VANIHQPERVVAVPKRPQREISGCGCLAFATTRSGSFFSLIERFCTLGVTYTLKSSKVWLKNLKLRHKSMY
jgi:hypothetical protein